MCSVLCEMCTVYTVPCVSHHCFVQPVLCFAVHPDWGTKEQRRVPPSSHILYPAIAFNAINTLLPDKPQLSKSSDLIRLTENVSLSGTSNQKAVKDIFILFSTLLLTTTTITTTICRGESAHGWWHFPFTPFTNNTFILDKQFNCIAKTLLQQTIPLFLANNSAVLPERATMSHIYPLVFQCAINKAHSSTRMPLHRPKSPFGPLFVSLVNGSEEASSFICALNWNWGWSKRHAVNIWSLLPRETKVTT